MIRSWRAVLAIVHDAIACAVAWLAAHWLRFNLDIPEQFLGLARRLPAICQYAAFDPPSRVGARARWVVPMTEVTQALQAARDETEGD